MAVFGAKADGRVLGIGIRFVPEEHIKIAELAGREAQGATLLPAAETTIRREPEPEQKKPGDELDVDAVFAKLKQLGGKSE